jgi:hypothetical protein
VKVASMTLILALIAGVLAGCGGTATPSSAQQGNSVLAQPAGADSATYTSQALDASYEGALPASSQLELGTLKLEGTENAVTPQQAKALLPLWQAIQSGSLKGNTETNAVYKQIEGTMTSQQLAAISAMQLTFEDLSAFAQDQGVALGSWPRAQATGQPTGSGQGGSGFPGNLTDEQRAAMRATAQAGGFNGTGPGGNMSADQRAAMRATAEASGVTFGGSRPGGGQGFLAPLAKPLIDLLTQRAAE